MMASTVVVLKNDVSSIHDLQKLVDDYIDNGSENSGSLQKEVFSSFQAFYAKNPLLHIVDSLASALTNTDVGKRAKGTGLLAECIHQCPPGSMDDLEVGTLIKFFCDRLKDHHSIQPMVIYAFLGLISYQEVNNELIITMLQSIFAEVHVQSLIQADRRNIFNIFSNLLKTKIHALKPFGADFVFGFIQAMDCEKDPRNLVICFENSYMIIKELDFDIFVEDLFEVLSCYFPIEFNEPKEDKFRIKKVDLVESLRRCLTAEKRFAPFAIPLYLEKLSSDMIESKLESLVTFTECLKIYKPDDVALFIDDIWLTIRKDYLLSDHKELDTSYLEFIYFLIKCLSKSDDNEPLVKIIDFLVKDCLQTFKDPEMIIAVPCSNVILRASNAYHFVFDKIVDRLILPIREALEKYISAHARSNMLEIINKILSVDNEKIVPNRSLVEFVDYLIPLLYDLLANGESGMVQMLSLKCLTNIVRKSEWFEGCNFDVLASHCFQLVREKVLTAQFLLEYRLFVQLLSGKFQAIFKKHFLEILEKEVFGKADDKIVSQCFNLLEYTSLANTDLVDTLYSYFSIFVFPESNIKSKDIQIVLCCYRNILKKSENNIEGKIFIIPLINIIKKTVDMSMDLLLKISHLLSISFKLLNMEQYKELFRCVYEMLIECCNSEKILFGSAINMKIDDNDDHTLLRFSVLLRGIFTQLKNEDLNEINVDYIFKVLLKYTGGDIDNMVLENFGITLGSIVNKLSPDSPLTKQCIDSLSSTLCGNKPCNSAVVLLSWVTKGVVLNWQSSTTIAIDLLLDCLNNEAVATSAVSGFDIIVRKIDEAFTKESFCTIKLMYKQRYTQYVLPLLIQRYYDGVDDVKSHHMIAISNTLHAIPKQLLQKHLKAMMPLLMHSLVTCNTPAITESTLSTILSVLEDNQEAIMDYVPSLLNSLLKHVMDSNMNVRILSLKSLAILSSYTPHLVVPMRTEVIRKVRGVLDDKKRLVRKEAMFCSNAWHLMTSGNE